MERITQLAKDPLSLNEEQIIDIRLAGLLHDVGHYPYSHLMERVDKVQLTEEVVDTQTTRTLDASIEKYPDHEDVGEMILLNQSDLVEAIGGIERAERVAKLFTKSSEDEQLSKLISSSLDMDRLDYLLRDAHAAGVAFGRIDLPYLLNNFCISEEGMVGVSDKALSAVEHYLLARFFMHKSVYYHKTTFGMEEACRQLLRRAKDSGRYDIPTDGSAVREIVKVTGLVNLRTRWSIS